MSKKKIIRHLAFLVLMVTGPAVLSQEGLLAQRISVRLVNATVGEAIGKISEAAGIHFSYNSSIIEKKRKITFSGIDILVSEALDTLTAQAGLEYAIIEGQVVLKKKKGKPENIVVPAKFTLNGFVRDKSGGEGLIGATLLVTGTVTGVITNSYGFYSITLEKGDYSLKVSYIGFLSREYSIALYQDEKLDIFLEENTALLREVTVNADEDNLAQQREQMSLVSIRPQSISRMPEFAGEVGLIRTLQTFPGITPHSDGSSFFFVRGGNKDQNLVLIDEAPVFNHSHLFGYYSVINPEAARDIKVYKGDIPVRYGDRLSSVVDIYTREGNMNRFGAGGMISPFLYGLQAEGPLIKEKSSFYLSYRHSNLSWLYRKELPYVDLYYFDINAKLNIKLNKNNRLYFTLFHGKDFLRNTEIGDRSGIEWDNRASTLRWNHIYNNKLFSNLLISGSLYNYYLGLTGLVWNSKISNANLKMDFSWYISPDNTAKFGFGLSGYGFNPGNLTADSVDSYFNKVPEYQSQEVFFHAEDEIALTPALSVKIGLRLPVWINRGPTSLYFFDEEYLPVDTLVIRNDSSYSAFVNLDPRISLKYRLGKRMAFNLSYGIIHQYFQMLSNSISPFSSFEVWVPAGPNISPQRAAQFALGCSGSPDALPLEFSAEFFYKRMFNQIDYEPHASLLLNPLYEGELRFGKARSYGIEMLVRKDKGTVTGWISYTWSRALRHFESLNGGKEYPAYYDRPHQISVFVSYQASRRSDFSATWIYYTGSAITTPAGFYNYNGYTVPYYDGVNNDRMPDYHRLDLSFQFRLNKKEGNFSHNLAFGVYNFYNRKNPVSINFNKIKTADGKFIVPADLFGTSELVVTRKYVLTIMPSITYKLKI
ncbi:MAG: TonB-dependent receptor [Bacteroidales bacterium]|nr:TonB-dependent receptor [Bacteroidales bacterium]